MRLGVARGCHDADFGAVAHERENARDDGVVGGETLPVVVEGDVAVEGDELEGPVAHEGHDLGGVEDEADVVEGGGHEAAHADEAALVLPDEGIVEGERGEEVCDRGDEELELRAVLGASLLVVY